MIMGGLRWKNDEKDGLGFGGAVEKKQNHILENKRKNDVEKWVAVFGVALSN